MHDFDDGDEHPVDPGWTGQDAGDAERVGYGRPPKRTRYAKGQSGNPKGRPKGSLNRATLRAIVAAQWLERTIKVTERGREREIPRAVALFMKQSDIALKGDRNTIKDCVELLFRVAADEPEHLGREESAADDMAILRTQLPERYPSDEPDPVLLGAEEEDSDD